RRGAAAERRRGGGRGRGPRTLDHRLLLQGRRPGQVPRRLAAHRRRGDDGRARLYPADRPGQGRDQVRWRVDLLDGTRERPDGPPRRDRGRGDRGGRRQMGGAAARGGGDPARRGGDRGEAAGLHDRADPALAASRALVLCRRSSEDQRWQVLQAADARGLPARRLRGHRGALTAFRPGLLCRGHLSAGTLWPTAPRVRLEDSPSPVYGAALLMRLGVTTLRGSNPRSSAASTWEHVKLTRAPVVVLIVIATSDWYTLGTARDERGDRDSRGLGQLLGHLKWRSRISELSECLSLACLSPEDRGGVAVDLG